MKRATRMALRPGAPSRRALERCAWARRRAFNAALAWHREEKAAGRPVPDEYKTAAFLRTWRDKKSAEHPDLLQVPARIFEYAAEDLERAWKAAQTRGAGRPCFEKYDPLGGGFAVDGAVIVTGAHVRLPRIGEIRLMPHGRGRVPDGKYVRVVRIVREHGEWFLSVVQDLPDPVRVTEVTPTVGLDWGVRKLATLSDGTRYENPRALERVAIGAEKARKSIARKVRTQDRKLGPTKRGERRPTSNRLRKARKRLARQLKRAADIRKDAIHQATAEIAQKHAVVAVEALKPKNLTRRRAGKGRAAKAALNARILDAAPGLFLSTLDQKLRDRRGGGNLPVGPAFSSQDCSALLPETSTICGARNDMGSREIYTCAACGSVLDRDVNAAKNLLARARVVAAGWSSTEKSAWSDGKPRAVRTSGGRARERKRGRAGGRNASV